MIEQTKIYAQGSIPEYEHDGDAFDRYYLPAKALCFQLAEPESLVVLPDDPAGNLRNYNNQLRQIYTELGIPVFCVRQPVFVEDSNYFLDRSLLANLQPLLDQTCPETEYRLMPYAYTEEADPWLDEFRRNNRKIEVGMNRKVYFDDLSHPGHRGGWGRNVKNPNELSFAEKYNIPYPVSYVGQGLEEVLEAYQRVIDQTGDERAYFKPVFSAGGFTLAAITSQDQLRTHYLELESQGALTILGQQSPIEVQEHLKIKELFSLQYESGHIVSPRVLTRQLVDGHKWIGNIFNSPISSDLISQSSNMFCSMVHGIRRRQGVDLLGSGGMDSASVERDDQEELVLIEHNGQRITGGHTAIALAKGLDVTQMYMTCKSPGEPNCDLATLWDVAKELNLQFDPSLRQGIFPIVWMPGSGMVWVAGQSEFKMRQSLDELYSELNRRQLIAAV